MPRVSTLVLLVALSAASPAIAQDQWGVSAGLTPSWQTGNPSRFLFAADQMNMKGSEVRFGVLRGDLTGGDWGFSFVDKSINDNSTLQVDTTTCGVDQCGTFFRVLSRTRLTGVELHQFLAYKTWRDRVQMGMVGAVGVGWLRGTVYKRTVSEQGVLESFTVPADELYKPSASVVPLVKLELAAAGIIGSGLKVRVAGGFSMPGYHAFDITVFYLIPGS